MASAGGVVSQPALGKAADVYGYPTTYVMSAGITALALPFIGRSRAENTPPTSPRNHRGAGARRALPHTRHA